MSVLTRHIDYLLEKGIASRRVNSKTQAQMVERLATVMLPQITSIMVDTLSAWCVNNNASITTAHVRNGMFNGWISCDRSKVSEVTQMLRKQVFN